MICQACGLYVPNPANGFYSLFPDFSNGLSIPSLAPIFGKLDFSILKTGEFFVIMFAFLFVDMFDTIGTLMVYLPRQTCSTKTENFRASRAR